ncbi:MAG: lysylphosphatidylglycerol synthase transmembrane domain-containing protein, partial [Gemmatimonadota bacterium]
LVLWPKRLVRLFESVAMRVLPADSRRRIVDALEAFLEGITSLRSPRLLVLALVWSVAFWCWHTLGFWMGFRAFGIEASYVAALFMNAIIAFAVAIPSSPGFFGTFHAGVTVALVGVFGVAEGPALAYAFGFHLAAFVPITVIGLWYVWRLGLSIAEIERSEARVEAAVEREHPVPEVER